MAKKNKNTPISAGELNAQSLDFLNLSKQPFANEILSDKSFFNTQSLTKIIDSLTHQAQFSDLLLLVEGMHGSGKTSLFRQFIQNGIANTKSLSMQAEVSDTLVQIQQKISLHLQDLGDANHLDENLKNLQMFDQVPLLIMDNSHVLSDTTLQELFRYQQQLKQEHEVTLKILLFANTGMSNTLQKITDIQADQIYVQNMPEFSPKQLDSFIDHRLRCAGYSAEPLLTSDDIQSLLKKCNATPLEIMHQAAPAIDKIINNKLNPASPVWLKALIIIGILSIVIAGAAYTYFLIGESDSQISANDLPPASTPANKTHDKTTNVIDVLESETITSDTDVIEEIRPKAVSVNESIDSTSHELDIAESTSTEALIIEEKPMPVVTVTTQPQTIKPAEPKTPSVLKPETVQKIMPVKEVAKTKIEAPAKLTPPVNPVFLELEKRGLQNTSWLSQQKTQNWTLQLLGAREPETLLKFAQRNNLSTDTAWYKTWLTSKPYYVLVYGSYNSRETARNAIAGLPPQLRALKPWVKSMKSVQQALK